MMGGWNAGSVSELCVESCELLWLRGGDERFREVVRGA